MRAMLPQASPPLQHGGGRTGPSPSPAVPPAHVITSSFPWRGAATPVSSPAALVQSRTGMHGPMSSAIPQPAPAAAPAAGTRKPQPTLTTDHSLLSTHSATSTAAGTSSRIEVRDVAELVRQLAESRCAARQLQQRMQQLETSTARSESLIETTGQSGAAVVMTTCAGEDRRERILATAAAAEGVRVPQTASPATSAPTVTIASEQQHGIASSNGQPALVKKRVLTVKSGHRRASVASEEEEEQEEEDSDASSAVATSSLTSTSTFISTSSEAALLESRRQRKEASAVRRSTRRPSSGAEASHAKSTSSTRRNAQHSHRSNNRHRVRSSRHHTPSRPTSSELKHHEKTRNNRTSRVDSTAAAVIAHRSRHRRHASHEQSPTSLEEREAREREAKELRRARRWQRRYYDLMSSYTRAKAQQEAELADIHDLIEYMSWEQDRARRLHLSDANSTTAAALTGEPMKPVGGSDGADVATVEERHTATRETRGTSPPPSLRPPSPPPLQCERRAAAAAAPPREMSKAHVREGVFTSPQRSLLSSGAEKTPSGMICCAAGEVEEEERVLDSAARVEATSSVSAGSGYGGQRGPVSVQRAEQHSPAVAATVALPPGVSAAAHEAESLRQEADAWRLRCLALLQQQQQSEPSYYHEESHHDTVDLSQLSYAAAVPPPLPPRPSTNTLHCAPRELSGNMASCTSLNTAQASEAERSRREAYEDSAAPPATTWSLLHGAPAVVQPLRGVERRGASAAPSSTLFSSGLASRRSDAQPSVPPLHRYAPPPPSPSGPLNTPTVAVAPLPSGQHSAPIEHHVDVPSPLRPPLFMALPDYRPANPNDWYASYRWSAAGPPSSEQPLQQERKERVEAPTAVYYVDAQRGPQATAAENAYPAETQRLRPPSRPPAPAASHPPFSPYAPDIFQTAPPSSSPAAAEIVVAREQLERDIRRHDQLLAAIGKLQKTAAAHASRSYS